MIAVEVPEEAQKNLLDFKGSGISIIESSHRAIQKMNEKKEGMTGLKEHCYVGRLRTSICNAMSLDGVQALVGLTQTFAAEKQ